MQPSRQPSSQPSQLPSWQPSSNPTSKPSIQPTNQPTCRPTNQPSEQPTLQPTSQPSTEPTSLPSARPSFSLLAPRQPNDTVNASLAINVLGSLIANQVSLFAIQDDIRLVSQVVQLTSGQGSLPFPVTAREQELLLAGNLTGVPAISLNIAGLSNNSSVFAVASLLGSSMWPPSSSPGDQQSPPPVAGQLVSSIVAISVRNSSYSSFNQSYVDINFLGSVKSFDETLPMNFTITCPPRYYLTKSHTCNDTGYVETVQCKGVAGVFKGTCPVLAQSCAALDLNSLTVAEDNVCTTTNVNATVNGVLVLGVICRCGLVGAGVVAGTGSVAAGVVLGLVTSDLSRTFQASSAIGDGSTASRVSVVLSLFAGGSKHSGNVDAYAESPPSFPHSHSTPSLKDEAHGFPNNSQCAALEAGELLKSKESNIRHQEATHNHASGNYGQVHRKKSFNIVHRHIPAAITSSNSDHMYRFAVDDTLPHKCIEELQRALQQYRQFLLQHPDGNLDSAVSLKKFDDAWCLDKITGEFCNVANFSVQDVATEELQRRFVQANIFHVMGKVDGVNNDPNFLIPKPLPSSTLMHKSSLEIMADSNSQLLPNAPEYFFVSHRVATRYPSLLESQFVHSYRTVWPGELGKRWRIELDKKSHQSKGQESQLQVVRTESGLPNKVLRGSSLWVSISWRQDILICLSSRFGGTTSKVKPSPEREERSESNVENAKPSSPPLLSLSRLEEYSLDSFSISSKEYSLSLSSNSSFGRESSSDFNSDLEHRDIRSTVVAGHTAEVEKVDGKCDDARSTMPAVTLNNGYLTCNHNCLEEMSPQSFSFSEDTVERGRRFRLSDLFSSASNSTINSSASRYESEYDSSDMESQVI
eukprot:gene26011-31410_t